MKSVLLAACMIAVGSLPDVAEAFLGGGAGFAAPLAQRQARLSGSGQTARLAMMAEDTIPNKKVVVTGVGAVTSIGMGADEFFTNLLKGEHGFAPLPDWAAEFPCKTAAPLKDFKAVEWYGNKKEAKRQSRYMHLGIAASKLGLKDAKLESDAIADKSRFGVLIGSAIGGSEYYEEASNKWGKHS